MVEWTNRNSKILSLLIQRKILKKVVSQKK